MGKGLFEGLWAEASVFGDFTLFLSKLINFKPVLTKLMLLNRGIKISTACKNMIKLAA